MNLLSRDEVCPRSNLSLSLAGTTLDPLAELQSLKGLKPGAVLRLVEGIAIVAVVIVKCLNTRAVRNILRYFDVFYCEYFSTRLSFVMQLTSWSSFGFLTTHFLLSDMPLSRIIYGITINYRTGISEQNNPVIILIPIISPPILLSLSHTHLSFSQLSVNC